MQPQAAVSRRAPAARTEAPTPSAINLQPLREALKALEETALKIQDLQAGYTDALKTVAEKSGIASHSIRAFVSARLVENKKTAERRKERTDQLSLLFEEIGL